MDDGELVDLLRRREERGMDGLLSQYGPMLRYIIAPILEDPREREECLSDTVMRAWDRIGQYDPARGSLAAWLSAIARNAAFSRLRAARGPDGGAELDPNAADSAPGPEELLLRKEQLALLSRAVSRLGDMDRQLFYRKYYYFQPAAQIAAELGLTVRGVEGRLHRLRKRLKRELGGGTDA